MREFKIDELELPIATLQNELKKKPKILYEIHDKKFEELVAKVLGEFYNVEVQIIGKRNDGGIDLIYIESDTPFAIQVKRRKTENKVETVEVVREFLGAVLLKGYSHGKLVTTASKFSSGAKLTKEEIIKTGLMHEFELMDFQRFLDMFHFTSSSKTDYPWEQVFAKDIVEWLNKTDVSITYKGFKNIQRTIKKYYYYSLNK